MPTPESLEIAKRLTGLDEKYLTPFDAADPFNSELRLEGFLSQRPDHRYGALAITHVGGEAAPQLIYATPKLHYPFGKDGNFHFPPIRRANCLETNDELIYEALEPLPLEEYQEDDIKKFRPVIDECIRMVRANSEFQARVMEEYKRVGVSIEADKAAVMRALSKVFSRDDMKKVYPAIVNAR